MYKIEECSQSDYHLLRLMAWHRRNFSYAILRTLGEEGSIEWFDYPYYSTAVSNYRELAHHGLQFLRKDQLIDEISFKDFYEVFPTEKPIKPLWNCIGKSSNETVVLISIIPRQIQSTQSINENQIKWFGNQGITLDTGLDYFEVKRCAVILYLNSRGIRAKQVDLMLIDAECETEEFLQLKEIILAEREEMAGKFYCMKTEEQKQLFNYVALGLDGDK